jgi:hypothetical protein
MTAVVTKTVAQLVDDTRFYANLINAQTNGATDARIIGLLNERGQELHDLVLSVDNSYYTQPYTFTLPDPVLQAAYTAQNLGTAPVNWSACPGGYYKDLGLDFNYTLPTPITCRNFNFSERNQIRGRRAWHTYRPMGRQAGVQVIEHLCAGSSDQTAGSYKLWFVGRAPVLAATTAIVVNAGVDAVSVTGGGTWSLSNAAFTQSDVGGSIIVAGAVHATNNGTFLITAVTNGTTIITGTAVGIVAETFNGAVTVSYQLSGTVGSLDDVQQIWNKYLTLGAALTLMGISEDDDGQIARQFAEQRQRVLNMAANRTSEPESLPIVESFGGDYYGFYSDGDDWGV